MSASIITEAEHRQYGQFCGDLIKTMCRPPPPILWHYTSGSSLINIIRTGQLFATQIACLNDQSEYHYSVYLYRDALLRLHSPEMTEDAAHLIEVIDQGLAPDKFTTSRNEWFVSCFSSKRDDLSQWRAYGGGENGFAIGFDGAALQHASPLSRWLVPVSYDKAFNAEVADKIAEATIGFFLDGLSRRPGVDRQDWTSAFLAAWTNQIGYFAPLMKDPAFAAEDEWRIIHPLKENDFESMQYVQRAALMSRHIPLSYPPPTDPTSKLLPIIEIIVGPGRHKEVSKISVGDLIRTYRYPKGVCKLSCSEIPFQGV